MKPTKVYLEANIEEEEEEIRQGCLTQSKAMKKLHV